MKKPISILLVMLLILTTILPATAADPIAVTSVSISEESVNLPVKKSINLKAIIEPKNATNKKLVWTSSDEAVATVKNGKVTGISAGEAVITATAEDGTGPSAEARVTVVQPVKKLMITGDQNISLPPSFTWRLTATVEPADATIKDVEWSTSNPKVADVDQRGVITAIDKGDAVITATSTDGSKTKASVKVKVSDYDLIFTSKSSQDVTYSYGSGIILVNGSVKTGCVRIPNVETSILAAIGREKRTESVSVSPVKPGTDTVTISVNDKKFIYKVFVSPEVFPETGLAAEGAIDSAAKDLLFLNIPWGSSYDKAGEILREQHLALKALTQRDGYMRTQTKTTYTFSNIEATHIYLNFRGNAADNAFFEGDIYFDKDVPLDQIELAVRMFYGLPQGELKDGSYIWHQGETILTLTQKEKFTILTFKQAEE